MRLERITTPETKLAFRTALGQAEKPLGLMQMKASEEPTTTVTTTALSLLLRRYSWLQRSRTQQGSGNRGDGTPDGELFHDLLSLEWGNLRDSFDEYDTA